MRPRLLASYCCRFLPGGGAAGADALWQRDSRDERRGSAPYISLGSDVKLRSCSRSRLVQLCRRQRALGSLPNAPLILLLGRSRRSDLARGYPSAPLPPVRCVSPPRRRPVIVFPLLSLCDDAGVSLVFVSFTFPPSCQSSLKLSLAVRLCLAPIPGPGPLPVCSDSSRSCPLH